LQGAGLFGNGPLAFGGIAALGGGGFVGGGFFCL